MGNAKKILAAILPIWAVAASGCGGMYSAPVQTIHAGAPGHMQQGDTRLSGTWTEDMVERLPHGGVQIDHAITDLLAIDLGADSAYSWAMGRAGLRVTPLNVKNQTRKLAYDVTFGGGLGVGGEIDCDSDDDEGDWSPEKWECPEGVRDDFDKGISFERLAGGGYAGVGVGYRLGRVTFFFRNNFELTKSDGLPMTFWHTAHVGFHWSFAEVAYVSVSLGTIAYVNRIYGDISPSLMVGFSWVWSKPAAPPKPWADPVAWL